jgi:hypothetical protein
MSVSVTCKRHPTYQAIRRSRGNCPVCHATYQAVKTIERAVPMQGGHGVTIHYHLNPKVTP